MKRRILAALLTVCMLFGMTVPVLADEAGVPTPAPETSEAQDTAEPTPTAEPTEALAEEPTATPEATATPVPEASAAPAEEQDAEAKPQAANDEIATYADTTDGKTKVYVYLKVANDTQGWGKENKDGWMTVGYVEVDGLNAASSYTSVGYGKYLGSSNELQQLVVNALKTNGQNDISKINLFSANASNLKEYYSVIDLDAAGYGLLVSNGAADYGGADTKAWHLDTYIDMSRYCKVTVRYHKDGNIVETTNIENIGTFYAHDEADKYDNYQLTSGTVKAEKKVNNETTSTSAALGLGEGDGYRLEQQVSYTIDLYYDPLYTVIYDYNDGQTANEIYKLLKGAETSTPAPSRKGYEFLGWKLEGDASDTLYESSKIFNVTSDMTFTAQWKRKTIDPAISIDNWKYDGSKAGSEQHPLTATLDIDGENVEPDTIEWYDESGNKLESAPKDAGSYTVKATWNETEDHDGASRETTFTISKRVVTIESGSDSKTYDGEPLTKAGTTETGDGFVGDEATSAATGSVTNVSDGKVTNTIEVTPKDGVDLDRNYTIVKKPGTLQIVPKDISNPDTPDTPDSEKTGITVGELDDVKYNGENQKQKPEVKDSKTGKTLEEGKDYDLVYSDDVKNVGEVTVTVVGKGNYTGETDVKYNITKRKIHLVSESGSRTYNGKPFTKPNVIESGDGFVKDEGFANCTATGSVTTVEQGKVTNTIVYTLNDKTDAGNYTITTEEGKLWVTANTGITVGELEDVLYNGGEQKQEPKVTDKDGNELVKGKDYELVYPDDVTNSGEVTVKVVGKGNFDGATGETSYEILPRRITLTSGSDHKVYDGEPLTKPGVSVGGDGFVDGEATVEATGTVTEVAEGTVANTIQLTKNSPNFDKNYSIIDINEGELYIEPKSIKPDDENTPDDKKTGITVEPLDDVKYNGEEQKQKPEVKDAKTGKTLEEGKDYDLVYSDDVKNVGEVTVTIKGKGNYTDTAEVKYNITKRKVTLESGSDHKIYDGEPLTKPGVTVGGDGFVNNDAAVKATGSVTEVAEGKVTNTIEITPKDAELFERNYTVEKTEGELYIEPKSIKPDDENTPDDKKTGITVEPLDDVKYNGEEQKKKPEVKDSKTGKTLEEGKDYDLVYSDDVKNVGEVTVTIKGKGNYTDTAEVKYNITKRAIHLVSGTGSRTYNGKPFTMPDVTKSGDGFVKDEGFAICKATGSVTDVAEGKVPNTISYTLNDKTDARNYTITTEEGELWVTANTGITVGELPSIKYDGTKHEFEPEVKDANTNKVLVKGKDYDLSYSEDTVNAGSVIVTVTGKGNYAGAEGSTSYMILKREITLESESAHKVYDGEPLTKPGVAVGGDGIVNNDAAVKATGTVTEVAEGKVTNTIEITPKDAELFERNYSVVTITEGELYIEPKSIKPDDENTPDEKKTGITVEPLEDVKYNGEEQKQKPEVKDSKTGKTLEEGKDYDLVYSDDVKNVGEVTVTIKGKGNYTDTVDVKYNITKRKVILESATDKKIYDRTPLTNNRVTTSGDGFANGEGFYCKVTGTITDVGSVENAFTAYPTENTKAENYEIEYIYGTLTVEPKSIANPDTPSTPDDKKTDITVTPPDDTIYNGKEQKKDPVVKHGDKVLEKGKDYDLSYSEDVTNPGTVTVTITGKGNYTEVTTVTYKILPVKEEKPAKPNKPDAAKRPKTGSSNLPAAAAAGAMLASGAGIAVLLRRKKKDEK